MTTRRKPTARSRLAPLSLSSSSIHVFALSTQSQSVPGLDTLFAYALPTILRLDRCCVWLGAFDAPSTLVVFANRETVSEPAVCSCPSTHLYLIYHFATSMPRIKITSRKIERVAVAPRFLCTDNEQGLRVGQRYFIDSQRVCRVSCSSPLSPRASENPTNKFQAVSRRRTVFPPTTRPRSTLENHRREQDALETPKRKRYKG